MPVKIPSGVTVEVNGGKLVVKGTKGSLTYDLPNGISGKVDDGVLQLQRSSEEREAKALHGLARALVNNMVHGVHKGFEKRMEIIGVGYRVQASGTKITLSLGFSHPIEMKAPDGVHVEVDKEVKNLIIVTGADKQAVGEFAANIRKLRKPEPYKGKGIRYVGEYVPRKAGKTAKK